MIRRKTALVDNRDVDQVYEYLEARIEALKRRIAELEMEKQTRNSGLSGGHPLSADNGGNPKMASVFFQRMAV